MKKKIINVFLMALLAMVTVGTVVSCKDYEEDNYSDLNGKFANLNEAVEAQAKALENRVGKLEEARTLIETDIQNLRNELGNVTDDATKTTIYGRLAAAEAAIETINNTIDEIKTTLDGKADQDALDKLTERVEKVEGCCEAIKELQGRVTTNEQEIDALQALIDADKVKVWEDGIADATSNAAKALALAQMDSIRLDRMEAWGDSIEGVLGDDFEDFKESVASALYDAENNVWKNLDDVIDEQLNLVKGSYTGTMEDIVKAYEDADKELAADIKAVNDRVDSLALVTDDLNDRLGMVESFMNKLISSVIIQGTENPVFGTFALPANISSNVLAAYYGEVSDLMFPTANPVNYVNAEDALSSDELEALGVTAANTFSIDGRVVSGLQADGKTVVPGNAGTLYLTVNPNTADLEGAAPVLVNSQDVESGVKLSSLEKTDKVLNFGFTRSAADNGFYAAKATVGVDAVESVSPRVSYEELKGLKDKIKDAVEAVREKGNVDVTGLIYSVYSLCSNVLDANAVKFPWSTIDYAGNPVQHATYSQYSLAATAVHPLSYGFMYGAHYDEFPGINKFEDIIGKIFDKVQNAIPEVDVDDVNINIDVKDFTFNDVDYPDGSISTTVEVTGSYTDDNGEVHEIDIDPIEVDITRQVEDAVNDALGGAAGDVTEYIKDIVGQLNGQVADINKMIEELRKVNEIGDQISDIEDQIYDYLSRAEDYLLKAINNANKLLQPMMLAKTADSYVVLSRSKSAPTKFDAASYDASNGIYLRPTSYTAEVLAPAYKKFIGVVNVYKDGKVADNAASLRSKVNNASEGFCTVQDGQWNKAQLKGLEKGYVYEIVYTAADFSGKIVVKRFFVELK